MTIISLCHDDPLVSLIYELFSANLVRVPDTRVRPLSVIVHRRGRSFYRGSLLPLLTDARALGVQPSASMLTNLAGRRSRRVALDLGLRILRGFLRGFGLPSAGLDAGLDGAASLTFAFPAVRRLALDLNALGWALTGRQIDRANPAAAILFAQPRYELLLIDSILTSRQISVTVSGAQGQQLAVNLDALRQIVADLGGKLEQSSDSSVELSLESPVELTFAFSCARLFFNHDGLITAIPPDHQRRTLSSADLAEASTTRSLPDRILLSPQPGLLIWDHETAVRV